jgi:hypothetical protein
LVACLAGVKGWSIEGSNECDSRSNALATFGFLVILIIFDTPILIVRLLKELIYSLKQ